MKVLILNGNPKEAYGEFDQYLNDLKQSMVNKSYETKLMMLRSIELHDCIGCYNCWLKTPGICRFDDGMAEILQEYLAADVVVYASPVIMSFISSLLKRVNDRMLPGVHPFIKLSEDRMSHVLRYSHYPQSILLLDNPENSGEESMKILEKIYSSSRRGAVKILSTQQDVEEICYEVVNN